MARLELRLRLLVFLALGLLAPTCLVQALAQSNDKARLSFSSAPQIGDPSAKRSSCSCKMQKKDSKSRAFASLRSAMTVHLSSWTSLSRCFGSVLADFVGLSEHEHEFQLHRASMDDGLSQIEPKMTKPYFSALFALLLVPSVLDVAETVTFPSGEITLHGALYKPEGTGPFPAVIYNHGSAPGMMSEQAFAALDPVFASHGWVFFGPYRRGH